MSSPLAALKSHLCIVPVSGSPFAATTSAARLLRHRGLRQLSRQSPRTLVFFLIRCIGSPACPIMSDAAVDTSSEITTKVRLDAARPFGVRALLPPERCLARARRLGCPEPAVSSSGGEPSPPGLGPQAAHSFVCGGGGGKRGGSRDARRGVGRAPSGPRGAGAGAEGLGWRVFYGS